MKRILLFVFSISLLTRLLSQSNVVPNPEMTLIDTTKKVEIKPEERKSHWYERISLRGYFQLRHNRIGVDNPKYVCDQCDRSWGDKRNFAIRRARLILSGQVSPELFIYIQPDLANTVGTSTHYLQIRDAYFDWSFDKKREFRLRFGQSKVPFGFENMQSSQNRLPLDRSDATNSMVANERDLGIFFYWAPEKVRALFKQVIEEGLKGSGDYGVLGFGLYNGQIANRLEANNDFHYVARASYPFQIGKQIIEPGVQGILGKYTLNAEDGLTIDKTTGKPKAKNNGTLNYDDSRIGATLNLYPKPFGILAEFNAGKGPEYDKDLDSITTKNLYGGFITASYMIKYKKQVIFPFIRYQYYKGGKKFERDATSHLVNEIEGGIEYQPTKNVEIVLEYVNGRRRFENAGNKTNDQIGSLFRTQFQFNF
jgi:Phosphate-selective porin O and P